MPRTLTTLAFCQLLGEVIAWTDALAPLRKS